MDQHIKYLTHSNKFIRMLARCVEKHNLSYLVWFETDVINISTKKGGISIIQYPYDKTIRVQGHLDNSNIPQINLYINPGEEENGIQSTLGILYEKFYSLD